MKNNFFHQNLPYISFCTTLCAQALIETFAPIALNSILFEREFSEAVVNWERSMREMAYIHVIDPILVNNGVKLDSDNKETLKEKPQYDDADSQRYSEDAVMRN